MNAWNSKQRRADPTEPECFAITASGARYMKIRVKSGAGTYALQTSVDGGATWQVHPDLGAMASPSDNTHAVDTTTGAPYLLGNLGRIVGAASSEVYVLQED